MTHPTNETRDFSGVKDARDLSIGLVPKGSQVLEVGCGSGDLARALRERGCRVWGIDRNAEAVAAARRWCETTTHADIEALDLKALARDRCFDVILCLDVLGYLVHPAAVLRDFIKLLAPEGRIVISTPNVTHAAVRLQLLRGQFSRTDCGLLDHRRLHLFDRDALEALCRKGGLTPVEWLRACRPIENTEIPVDVRAFPEETVRMALAGPDAETYQFVVSAIPDPAAPDQVTKGEFGPLPGRHFEEGDKSDQHQNTLQAQVAHLRVQLRQLKQQQAAQGQREARELAHLQRDVLVKDAYLAELREARRRLHDELQQVSTGRQKVTADFYKANSMLQSTITSLKGDLQEAKGQLERLRKQHLETLAGIDVEEQRAATRISLLEAALTASQHRESEAAVAFTQQHEALEAVRDELAQREQFWAKLREGYADRLGQPRYRLADTFNARLKRVPPLHKLLRWIALSLAR